MKEFIREMQEHTLRLELLTDEMIELRVQMARESAVSAAFAHYDYLYNELLARVEHLERMQ